MGTGEKRPENEITAMMSPLEQRMKDKKWKLVNKERIHGAHAGQIFRVLVDEGDNRKDSYVYKEFADGRENEVELYLKIPVQMNRFGVIEDVWDEKPKAMLMKDLASPLKGSFSLLSFKEKKNVLQEILQRLSDLHTSDLPEKDMEIHTLSFEWKTWCVEELTKICERYQWASRQWIDVIEEIDKGRSAGKKRLKCPLVLTHGDPHMENVFRYKGEICFIDWEWAALGSPLRDLTILMQDLYDVELIQYATQGYRSMLKSKNLFIEKEDYQSDFTLLYLAHTTMMLAWEIHKFFKGYLTEADIQRIIEFKIGEIRRVASERPDDTDPKE
ncbi:phosphotransferase family protein [Bacillus sp. KH172YL63]|uniref:phosphotransferase family protein n=1 Tax=Bacillus sp. KH172YL63 TaxID=2709784 RepID=UPI0013E473F6|nr:aminoglycoside phosphotransferase family protein [Bacillus sp. KH172YL63]BCB02544.1 hypothetical protein KH172YL63_06770 [Bacillus sp. KH172YL63]